MEKDTVDSRKWIPHRLQSGLKTPLVQMWISSDIQKLPCVRHFISELYRCESHTRRSFKKNSRINPPGVAADFRQG